MPPFPQKKALPQNKLKGLKRANIKIKIALSGNEKDIKKINTKFRLKAKQIDIDTRFYIADNDQVLFMISKGDSNNEEIAVWLNTPFFANSLAFMFDQATREETKSK